MPRRLPRQVPAASPPGPGGDPLPPAAAPGSLVGITVASFLAEGTLTATAGFTLAWATLLTSTRALSAPHA